MHNFQWEIYVWATIQTRNQADLFRFYAFTHSEENKRFSAKIFYLWNFNSDTVRSRMSNLGRNVDNTAGSLRNVFNGLIIWRHESANFTNIREMCSGSFGQLFLLSHLYMCQDSDHVQVWKYLRFFVAFFSSCHFFFLLLLFFIYRDQFSKKFINIYALYMHIKIYIPKIKQTANDCFWHAKSTLKEQWIRGSNLPRTTKIQEFETSVLIFVQFLANRWSATKSSIYPLDITFIKKQIDITFIKKQIEKKKIFKMQIDLKCPKIWQKDLKLDLRDQPIIDF